MTAAEVTVQRLRLRSAAPGLGARVEDALRVSSKPPALLNRLLLVRQLRLRTATDASAQTLAMQLEQAWQQLAAQAQPLEAAGDSAAAEAVWAPSLAVARLALLRRWLRGDGTSAWFWQRIAPPQTAGAAWPARAVAMLLSPPDEGLGEGAPTNTAAQAAQARAMLALIAEQGATAALLEAASEAQAEAVLRLVDVSQAAPRATPRQAHGEPPAARAAAPRARLFTLMTSWAAQATVRSPHSRIAPLAEVSVAPAAAEAITPHLDRVSSTPPAVGSAARAASPIPRPANLQEGPAAITLGHGLPSAWSGLWLLLPMLLRHGLDDADDPLAAWAGAVQAACQRFRIPAGEPIHTALSALDLPTGDGAWLRRARLAAVRDAGLPLLRIARRPGTAWVSPERIDIEFPARALDLRIRRAGFDIDPGFLPWLGRIVHFHYPTS